VQVEQAIMMMGFGTFFREVAPAPVVEDILRGQVDALLQLLQTVRLAQRASRYAFDWALLLHDLHAEEVRIAALLSSLGEMLMWCFNPQPMLGMRAMQAADKGLRSAEVQQQVLGFRGMDLQQALATEWHSAGAAANAGGSGPGWERARTQRDAGAESGSPLGERLGQCCAA